MGAQEESRRQAGASAETARAVWNDATDVARTVASQQQQAAAQGLGNFAGALHDAARHADDGNGTTSRLAHGIADGLDRVARQLKSRDLDSLVREVEDFARNQPLVFFGAAVATGFIALRFLRSSAPDVTSAAAPAGSGASVARGDTARAGDGAPAAWPDLDLDPLERSLRSPGPSSRSDR